MHAQHAADVGLRSRFATATGECGFQICNRQCWFVFRLCRLLSSLLCALFQRLPCTVAGCPGCFFVGQQDCRSSVACGAIFTDPRRHERA